MAEVTRATQAGLTVVGDRSVNTDVRVTQAGLTVVASLTTPAAVKVTQAGLVIVGGNLFPQTPFLSVSPLPLSFYATTSAFAKSTGATDDEHLSTVFEIAADGDTEFSAVLFTFTYTAPSPYLTAAILDGLGSGVTYLIRARHEGVEGFSQWSNTVEETTLAGILPDAPTVTILATGTDFVSVQGSDFSHPDGETTRDDFDFANPLPFLEFSEFQVRVTSSGVVITTTGPLPVSPDATYGTFTDLDLNDDTAYQVRARYWEGYQNTVSPWGSWADFSTDAIPLVKPDAPAVTVANCLPGEVTLSAAAFSHIDPLAVHTATRWRATHSGGDDGAPYSTTVVGELTAFIFSDLPPGTWTFDAQYQDDSGRWSDWGASDTCAQLAYPEVPVFNYNGGVRICVPTAITWSMEDGTSGFWKFDGAVSADGGNTWTTVFSGSSAESYFFTFSGRPNGSYLLRIRADYPTATFPGDWAYLVVRVDRTCAEVVHYDFSKPSTYSAALTGWKKLWNDAFEWSFINDQGEPGNDFALLARFPVGLEVGAPGDPDWDPTPGFEPGCLVFPELGEPVTYEIDVEFFVFGNERNNWWYKWIQTSLSRPGIAYSVSGTRALNNQLGLSTMMGSGNPWKVPAFGGGCCRQIGLDWPYIIYECFPCNNPCIEDGCVCGITAGTVANYITRNPNNLIRYGVAPYESQSITYLKYSYPGLGYIPYWLSASPGGWRIPSAGDKTRGISMVTQKSPSGAVPGRSKPYQQYLPAPDCEYRNHPRYTMRQKVTRSPTGGVYVKTKVVGPGIDPTQGWDSEEVIPRDHLTRIQCGSVGLAVQNLFNSLDPVIGVAFTSFTISNREYDICEPPPDFVPPEDLPEGLTVGRPCVVILEVYEEDRETIKWQVGDYREHPNPFLCLLENYGEQEVDPVSGAVTIGQVEVVVIDRRQVAGDQDTGWLTERLGVSTVGAIHGRRCRVLRYISEALGWVVIADGPASTPTMDASYVAFRWVVKDTRETERKVKAFVKANTSTLLPMGAEPGFGAYIDEDGNDAWLVDPATPLVGTYSYDPLDPLKPFPVGTVEFQDYWSGGFGHGGNPIGDQVINEAVVITAPVEKAFLADAEELGDPRPVLWTWPQLEIVWRLVGSSDPWNVVQPTDLLPAGRTTAKPTGAGQWWRSLITPWDAELADGTAVRGALYMTLRGYGATGTFPTDGDEIEILIRYTGEPTEDFPIHIEGMTSGEFLKKLYDGEYSPPDPITGAVVPTAIRYNETDLLRMGGGTSFVSLGTGLGSITLADGGTLLLETSPTAVDRVLLRQTEVVDDLRSWAEEHVYSPTGWFPALNNDGEISPRNQVPPTDFSQLLHIHNAVTEPQPDWDAGERIVNVLTYIYPRWMVADVGDIDAVDRLMEREITQEYRDESSVTRHAIQQVTYEGDVFSALGDVGGQPIVGGTAQEQGSELAALRKLYVFDRYRNGAPTIQVPVMRRHCSLIRAGDWVVIDLSWFPDYVTKERGLITGAQVLAVYDVDCAWRILLLEEAFPITEES